LKKAVIIIFLVVVIDQIIKIWVKTSFVLGEEINVIGNWFKIHFTENNGMAFGWEINGNYGKMILTSFRLIALAIIGFYISKLSKSQENSKYITPVSLIFAGALGNIIDSIFYGKIFSDSYFKIAEILPEEGGYASWFHGKVVDMFYFPIINTTLPSWFPLWGDEPFIFFAPVFNISDVSITIGVFLLLIIYNRK